MKRILITGANGMLGTALFDELKNRHNLFLTGTQNQSVVKFHNYLKFDLSSQSYKELIDWSKPDIVIHCAAIVDGTLCEKKPQLAFEVERAFNSAVNRYDFEMIAELMKFSANAPSRKVIQVALERAMDKAKAT